jgi:hypothetical protein
MWGHVYGHSEQTQSQYSEWDVHMLLHLRKGTKRLLYVLHASEWLWKGKQLLGSYVNMAAQDKVSSRPTLVQTPTPL